VSPVETLVVVTVAAFAAGAALGVLGLVLLWIKSRIE